MNVLHLYIFHNRKSKDREKGVGEDTNSAEYSKTYGSEGEINNTNRTEQMKTMEEKTMPLPTIIVPSYDTAKRQPFNKDDIPSLEDGLYIVENAQYEGFADRYQE